MRRDYTGAELIDYEGDRVIEVNKYDSYHGAYDCIIYELTYQNDCGEPEMSTEGNPALLTQADLDRIN